MNNERARSNYNGIGLLALGLGLAIYTSAGAAADTLFALDDNGQVIGLVERVDSAQQRMHVIVDVAGEPVMLLADTESFSHATRPYVYFSNGDCTGVSYMSPGDSLARPAAVAGPDATLFFGDWESRALVRVASRLGQEDCEPLRGEFELLEATPVANLASLYSPPFRVLASDAVTRRMHELQRLVRQTHKLMRMLPP